ncbi:pseudaminic acid cytidylyltransferase [Bacteroides heparinolyticus]|uniref:pseudaminic acid cytidylyltransferase n=1 Tax=Prevotella heparinolytica TaxID=28113 RepID=UPI000D04305F|nr:pseudaminic acid cytidylyltransferase [Bacteroides heparinolyticus]AVM58650.1 pseudaminic acid cytidylyltransferase [Bacteroides heparinolyticus]
MKNLCIIPARGGSKRIPRKNVKRFLGKPMLAYSIEAALKTGLFDEVMVSTDDEEIAEVARQYGAKVPFMRSAETANDFATTADVLNEVISNYKASGIEFDNFCCIYATAPMTQSEDITAAYERLLSSDFTVVYPVVQFSYPIWRCLDLAEDGTMKRHWPEYENSRSQDLPKEYHDTGTFYWYKTAGWLSGNIKIGGVEVDETRIQDIDTETDWKLAEMKYKLLFNDKA